MKADLIYDKKSNDYAVNPDFVYDCESDTFIVYKNKYTGEEIHIPKKQTFNKVIKVVQLTDGDHNGDGADIIDNFAFGTRQECLKIIKGDIRNESEALKSNIEFLDGVWLEEEDIDVEELIDTLDKDKDQFVAKYLCNDMTVRHVTYQIFQDISLS